MLYLYDRITHASPLILFLQVISWTESSVDATQIINFSKP